MKTVVDNLKAPTIQHGFCACGLFHGIPQPSIVEVNKNKNDKATPDRLTNSITFESFKTLIDDRKLKMLDNFTGSYSLSDDLLIQFLLIQKVFKKERNW